MDSKNNTENISEKYKDFLNNVQHMISFLSSRIIEKDLEEYIENDKLKIDSSIKMISDLMKINNFNSQFKESFEFLTDKIDEYSNNILLLEALRRCYGLIIKCLYESHPEIYNKIIESVNSSLRYVDEINKTKNQTTKEWLKLMI